MHVSSRSGILTCVAVVVCVLGFGLWCDHGRVRRVQHVTRTDAEGAVIDPASPTGFAGGRRWLIVPEHNNRSYTWIAQAQRMVAHGEWRIRHREDENAPVGHAVQSPSPYRWWLGFVGECDHLLSGCPIAAAIENAALWADPVLHLAGLLATTLFVLWQFGAGAAAVTALGLGAFYPLAASFLPGVPDDTGLSRLLAFWSVLPLLITRNTPAGRRRWYFAGGIIGASAMWVNVAAGLTTVLGIGVGAIVATVVMARADGRTPDPNRTGDGVAGGRWRWWALGGALGCLIAYLIEYFPSHLEFDLRMNHPLYGVGWLGLGELLTYLERCAAERRLVRQPRALLAVALGLAGVVLVPIVIARNGTAWPWSLDPYAGRLTFLPNGVVAPNFLTWIARDGVTRTVVVTLLPLAILVPALWRIIGRSASVEERAALALPVGFVVVTLVVATRQIAWWSLVDVALLAVLLTLVASLRAVTPARQLGWGVFVGAITIAGVVELRPLWPPRGDFEFTRLEVEALMERRLAHWVAAHGPPGGAVILLPPDRTTSWCFHGGMRGLGSTNWENRAGLAATVKIVTATTEAEAEAFIKEHGVTHLVLPSWDGDLDQFARWSLRNPEDAFVSALHHWALPPWLKPVPYRLPAVAGFEDQTVVILEVTDNANRAVGLARLAEYFVETEQPTLAAWIDETLQRYPADLGCLIARAQIAHARQDAAGFKRAFEAIAASVNGGFDRTLGWDRRVSLAIVLALADRNDLARAQLRRCIETVDADRIRSLSTASLYRLLVLDKAYGPPIPDPALGALARSLLPAELRERL